MSKTIKLLLCAFILVGLVVIVKFLKIANEIQTAAIIKSQTEITSTDVSKQGTLIVTHGDDFVNKVEIPYSFLQESNGKLTELVLSSKEEIPEEKSGYTVSLKGNMVGGKLVVSSLSKINFSSPSPSSLKTVPPTFPVTKKVAVILFNFQNNTNSPYTVADAKKMVFTDPSTNPQAVNGFFKENSFSKMQLGGKINPTGDVFGIYTVPFNNSQCDFYDWGNSADTFAVADGYNSASYDSTIYIFPSTASCGWGGIALSSSTMPNRAWSNGGWYGNVIHELGHNLGFWSHSNALICKNSVGTKTSISNDCSIKEYGDPFDIMAGTVRHFNNAKKDYFNFFTSNQITTVTQSGTYTLYASETAVNGPQVIRIPIESDSSGKPIVYYYLELRKSYGVYDAFNANDPAVKGISIRVVGNSYGQTYIVDTTPNSVPSNDFSDAPLAVGQTFTDTDRGITITTTSITNVTTGGSSSSVNPKAQININITGQPWACVRSNPTFSITPSILQGSIGQSKTVNYTITNNDTIQCGSSTPSKFKWSVDSPLISNSFKVAFPLVGAGQTAAFTDQFIISCNPPYVSGYISSGVTRISPFYYDYGINPVSPFFPTNNANSSIYLTIVPPPVNAPNYCGNIINNI